MRNFIRHAKGFVFGVGFAGALALVPALACPVRAETPAAEKASVKPDLKKVNDHLTQHQSYPATRAQLLATCNGLVDFSAGEKRWFAAHLPEGTYSSPADVMAALTRK